MDLYQNNPEFKLAQSICESLTKKGHKALLAGGCVRDFLLQRKVNDFDVATSATPDEVEALFPKTIAVGKAFGVIVVIEQEMLVEVATFRKDGNYEDGRRPKTVEYSEAQEDAKRRDFTVNGLFYDLQSKQVIDYVEGLSDLKKRQIRAIGDAKKRFEEDHLRILRAVRFAAQLDFEIETETLKAISRDPQLIQTVSGERIQDELTKLLLSPAVGKALKILFDCGLLESLMGVVRLQWTSPEDLFSKNQALKEDLWFRFFFWLRQASQNSLGLKDFEKLCDQWKFSRDLKQKTLKGLAWTYESQIFLKHSLGELLAQSFEPEHMRGIQAYIDFFLVDSEKAQMQRFLTLQQEWGFEKPEAWLLPKDLMQKYQGEDLGRALKQSYWQQLEKAYPNKEELLKQWLK